MRQRVHDGEHGQGFRAVRPAGHEQVDDGPAQGLNPARHGQGPVETKHVARRQDRRPALGGCLLLRTFTRRPARPARPARPPQCQPYKSPVAINHHGQFRQDAEIGRDDGQQNRIGLHDRGGQEHEYGQDAHAHAGHHGIADDVGPPDAQQQTRQKPRDPNDKRKGQQVSEGSAHDTAEARVHGVKLVDHP